MFLKPIKILICESYFANHFSESPVKGTKEVTFSLIMIVVEPEFDFESYAYVLFVVWS